jgi:hypothetical protein
MRPSASQRASAGVREMVGNPTSPVRVGSVRSESSTESRTKPVRSNI